MGKKKKACLRRQVKVPSKALEQKVKKLVLAGTQESLWALEKLARDVESPEEENYVELMLDEAQFQFYAPKNEQEKNDLRLAKMIMDRDEQFWNMDMKAESAASKLENLAFDKKVHERVMASKDGKKHKDWQYNYCHDFETIVRQREAELRDRLAYEASWVCEAKMMLKTEKYLELPFDFFENNIFFADDNRFWEDADDDVGGDDDE